MQTSAWWGWCTGRKLQQQGRNGTEPLSVHCFQPLAQPGIAAVGAASHGSVASRSRGSGTDLVSR